MENPRWLEWAQRLQAIAQTGLSYSKDIFDTERYIAIRSIAAEMMATGCGAVDASRFVDMFKGDAGYATPKVDVRAAAFDAGRVLLVRESEDGRWTLPGGWADVGEAPSLAAVREVREECGYEVMPTKLAAVYDRNQHGHPVIPFHAYKLFFICSITGGAAGNGIETDAVDFFEEDQIPPLSTTRVTLSQIEHMFGHYRHSEWPTSFDSVVGNELSGAPLAKNARRVSWMWRHVYDLSTNNHGAAGDRGLFPYCEATECTGARS